MRGELVMMSVLPELTIADLKAMIEDKVGHNEEYVRLLFAGKPLEDDRTLEDYSIHADSTLHMVVRAKPRNNAI